MLRTEKEAKRVDRRLRELRNRATRYERVVEIDGGKFLAGYSRRMNKVDLLDAAAPLPEETAERVGLTEDSESTYSRDEGWTFHGERGTVRLYYGRTERTALVEGELPRYERGMGNNT